MNLVCYVFTYFKVFVNLTGFGQGYLRIFILQRVIFYDGAVAPNFKVAFVGIDDNVVVFIGAEHFGQHVPERLFEYADHGRAVNVFQLLEFRKGINQTDCFYFLCHW